jgi:hypothetical protein
MVKDVRKINFLSYKLESVTSLMEYIPLTLSQLMLHICGVSKPFGEWYQKTNKTEDTNKLTLFVSSVLFVF